MTEFAECPVDLHYLAENQPSLCIPRVFSNIKEDFIRSTFDKLGLGKIQRIDLLERRTERGEVYNRAFIHFEKWFWNNDAQEARKRLIIGKDIKIVYDNPWFWKVSANKWSPRTSERRGAQLPSLVHPHVPTPPTIVLPVAPTLNVAPTLSVPLAATLSGIYPAPEAKIVANVADHRNKRGPFNKEYRNKKRNDYSSRPAANRERPAANRERPAANPERPAANPERPAANPERPAANPESVVETHAIVTPPPLIRRPHTPPRAPMKTRDTSHEEEDRDEANFTEHEVITEEIINNNFNVTDVRDIDYGNVPYPPARRILKRNAKKVAVPPLQLDEVAQMATSSSATMPIDPLYEDLEALPKDFEIIDINN